MENDEEKLILGKGISQFLLCSENLIAQLNGIMRK